MTKAENIQNLKTTIKMIELSFMDTIDDLENDLGHKLSKWDMLELFARHYEGYMENWSMNKCEFPDLFPDE